MYHFRIKDPEKHFIILNINNYSLAMNLSLQTVYQALQISAALPVINFAKYAADIIALSLLFLANKIHELDIRSLKYFY